MVEIEGKEGGVQGGELFLTMDSGLPPAASLCFLCAVIPVLQCMCQNNLFCAAVHFFHLGYRKVSRRTFSSVDNNAPNNTTGVVGACSTHHLLAVIYAFSGR